MHCIKIWQGKGSGGKWMAKEYAVPTDSRDKVGIPGSKDGIPLDCAFF